MSFFVYAISSTKRNYLYVGLTQNYDKRLERHEKGWSKTTRAYKPFELIFLTEIGDRMTARLVEKYLKSGAGKEFLKSLTI
jgi:putative endonuclease